MGWGGVGRDVNVHVHVTLMMLSWSWGGVGWGGMLTFTFRLRWWCYVDHEAGWGGVGCQRLCSCYADDVKLIMGWGGVRRDVNVHVQVTMMMSRWSWGGVGWGRMFHEYLSLSEVAYQKNPLVDHRFPYKNSQKWEVHPPFQTHQFSVWQHGLEPVI